MPLKEVNQGLEQITYVGHEGAMDVQELTVTIDTAEPANTHGIVTYKNGVALVAGTTAPRDWTHMILRKRTSDGREFIMEPAGDKLNGIITSKNQYIYDATTREIYVSGWAATDTYLLSCFTTNGANLAPLSFVENLNITENLATRKVFDRKTLDHFKRGRPDPSASLSQKFVDFFEPENVRQLYSPARALTEFYDQQISSASFGSSAGGAADVYAVSFQYPDGAGTANFVDQTVSTRSSNFLRTPAGADLTEQSSLANVQANPDSFFLSTAATAESANGSLTIDDYTNIVGGRRDSRRLTYSANLTPWGSNDTLDVTYDQAQDTLVLTFGPDLNGGGNIDVDITDTLAAGSIIGGPQTVAVGAADNAIAVAAAVFAIVDPLIPGTFTFTDNTDGTLTLVRNAKGNQGTLDGDFTDTGVTGVTYAEAFTAPTGGTLAINIEYPAATSILGGGVNVVILASDDQDDIASKVHAAISGNLSAGFTLAAYGGADTIQITRDTTGQIGAQAIVSTFGAGGSSATEASSNFTAGDDTGTIDVDIFVSGTNPTTVNVTDKLTDDQIATAVAGALNADVNHNTELFAIASTGGIVDVYEQGQTGAGTGISANAYDDTASTTAIGEVIAANSAGVAGSTFTLGSRTFEFLTNGLSGNGITVTPGNVEIEVGTSNNTTASNASTAIGTGQTLTTEVNSPSVATNVVQLESPALGSSENIDITGQSLATAYTFLGMSGGLDASASVLYVSTAAGTPLETGNYEFSYQKDSVACAPTLVIRNDVLDCSNALLYSEYLVAVTPSSINWSAPAEDDATMDFDLLVGVKPGNNTDLS